MAPPAWFAQVAWDERPWLGHWGHRTVGLHRVVLDGESYQTFAQTMQSTLERWLRVAREAYAFVGVDPSVATVVFGYLNAFTLKPDDGDLSEWFRFNFALEAAGAAAGLSEIAVAACIPRPERISAVLSERPHPDARVAPADRDEVIRRVAVACLKYGMLSIGTNKRVVYSLDGWTNPEGDTGAYLLYGLARIRSILRKAGENVSVAPGTAFGEAVEERALLGHLLELPLVIRRATE